MHDGRHDHRDHGRGDGLGYVDISPATLRDHDHPASRPEPATSGQRVLLRRRSLDHLRRRRDGGESPRPLRPATPSCAGQIRHRDVRRDRGRPARDGHHLHHQHRASTTSAHIPIQVSASVTNVVANPSVLSATVAGRVWFDVDGDGDQDIGEPGIAERRGHAQGPVRNAGGVDGDRRERPLPLRRGAAGDGYYVEVTGGLPSGLSKTFPTSVSGQPHDGLQPGGRPDVQRGRPRVPGRHRGRQRDLRGPGLGRRRPGRRA